MTLSIKPRVSKKYIGFIVIFNLLIVTSLVNVECPVCQGTGLVSAPGMENVEIITVKSELRIVGVSMGHKMCVYDVELSVINNGPDDTEGYIKLALLDLSEDDEFAKDSVLDEVYVTLEVPGGTSLDATYAVFFRVRAYFIQSKTKIYAEVVYVTDVTCNGTGKVPLNSWLLVNGLKNSFREGSVSPQPPGGTIMGSP